MPRISSGPGASFIAAYFVLVIVGLLIPLAVFLFYSAVDLFQEDGHTVAVVTYSDYVPNERGSGYHDEVSTELFVKSDNESSDIPDVWMSEGTTLLAWGKTRLQISNIHEHYCSAAAYFLFFMPLMIAFVILFSFLLIGSVLPEKKESKVKVSLQ